MTRKTTTTNILPIQTTSTTTITNNNMGDDADSHADFNEYGDQPNPTFTAVDDGTHSLQFRYDSETVLLTPWGPNALRIRATHEATLPSEEWALTEPIATKAGDVAIELGSTTASITNGKLRATVTRFGKITMVDTSTGKVVLEEFARHRMDVTDPKTSALRIGAREFTPRLGGGEYRLTARFESLDGAEKVFGMGQYQQPFMDLKGAELELAQRNSQASVPFCVSSLGYGFLWNNPAVGRVVFGKGGTTWVAESTRALDYWVVVGKGPGEIVRGYTGVTGRVPVMPEYGLGFWQCKLRYQTQEELLGVARGYRERGLKLDLIVVDYFHWPNQGDWKFDPTYWPDPEGMVRELKEMGVELMVSVWPTVESGSENWGEMLRRGLLVRQDRGVRVSMEGRGQPVHFDATNPEAREFVWGRVKKNYHDIGVRVFWLDEAE